jgi:hypothetical protein
MPRKNALNAHLGNWLEALFAFGLLRGALLVVINTCSSASEL